MSRGAAEIDGFPSIDGDEVDMVLYRMQSRIDLLDEFIAQTGGYDVRSRAIESLVGDWKRFREELVPAVRHSVEFGFIQNAAPQSSAAIRREEVTR